MLSDTKIKKAAPTDRDYKLADEKGLFLLVRKTEGSSTAWTLSAVAMSLLPGPGGRGLSCPMS